MDWVDELISLIGEYDALVVRSETKVTAPVVEAGTRLRVIARAGVGVDNIDVEAASRHGIVVVNSPTGNIEAAAEHTIGLLFALARHIPMANAALAGRHGGNARATSAPSCGIRRWASSALAKLDSRSPGAPVRAAWG